MNATENYKKIVEDIFQQKVNIPITKNNNNCIGALNHNDEFLIFKNNFIERLVRIREFYKNDNDTLNNILKTVKDISIAKDLKWSGAYSELVALDYWRGFVDIRELKFIDRGDVNSFPNSIARKIGNQEIDLDISFRLATKKIFMDVKSLIPTHLELVDKILVQLKKKTGNIEYQIGIDNIFRADYLGTKEDYIHEIKTGNLVNELEKCVVDRKANYKHVLQSGQEATFSMAYSKPKKNTVLMTLRSMNAYRLAEDYKYKILDYYNKLLIKEPSFITFVFNSWFNTEIYDFDKFNESFYRALARRTFIELTKNKDDMGLYYPELMGRGLKIKNVASLITGIIFIEDHSITKTGNEMYNAFIYLNPNAKNTVLHIHDFDCLKWSKSPKYSPVIEDFEYDNY